MHVFFQSVYLEEEVTLHHSAKTTHEQFGRVLCEVDQMNLKYNQLFSRFCTALKVGDLFSAWVVLI